MESYKHSCPCCGQHMEYTAPYCGKKTLCPTCGHTITFPAMAPGRYAVVVVVEVDVFERTSVLVSV